MRNFGEEKEEINHIEEIIRSGSVCTVKNILIPSTYAVENIFTGSIEYIINEYLNIFQSNTPLINALPYYLIPMTTSLRYLLIEKLNFNSFIFKDNDKLYTHLINRNKNSETASPITKLYHYELEALLASCIAALTFTFLNKSSCSFIEKDKQTIAESTPDFQSIKNNIKKYGPILDFNSNMYDNLRNNKDRSLQLKSHFDLENLQKNKNQFENAIQIYAEFRNILIMNSYILQVLNLKEFSSFYSMYHYQWEEAFYSMVYFFKIAKDNQISFIFNHLFSVNPSDEKTEIFINYLQDHYLKALNAIITI